MSTFALGSRATVVLTALALLASSIYAQFVSGSLGGRIVDPSGAPVGEAIVTLMQTQTGTTSRSLTNAEGEFQFPSVLSGEYNLQVEKQGFQVRIPVEVGH